MANLFSFHSVGNSLVTFLRNTYPESLRAEIPYDFSLVCGDELDAEGNPFGETAGFTPAGRSRPVSRARRG